MAAIFWGDPHIKTLDGKGYTFNGWGEFTMLNVIKKDGDVLRQAIQGRTARAVHSDGNFTDATVFSAFAAKDFENNATFHVELTRLKDGKILQHVSLHVKESPFIYSQGI